MGLINGIILEISQAGQSMTTYLFINNVFFYFSIMVGLLRGRKLQVGLVATVIAVAAERILASPLSNVILFVQNGFVKTGEMNVVVVFAWVPLTAYLLSLLVRRPWKQIWDLLMPLPLVMFVGARFACTVEGCCRGVPCDWGIYNSITGQTVFPVQLLESLVTILILIKVFRREKKNNFATDGRNVPIILINYGIARFFLEFLHDNAKIIFGMNAMSFHCLFMILVGIFCLWIIRRSEGDNCPPLRDDPALRLGL